MNGGSYHGPVSAGDLMKPAKATSQQNGYHKEDDEVCSRLMLLVLDDLQHNLMHR